MTYELWSQQLTATLAPLSPHVLWIVIVGFIVAFFLAFGVGANDVANSFGTSVGSKVLTLRQACILATIFEILGAVTLGYKVSGTIRTGMIEVELFTGQEKRLMLGYLSALLGGAIWNLVATFAGLPISGTHSIVGAIVGFSIVDKGFGSIKWYPPMVKIVASWFVSPLLSGIVSVVLFVLIRKFILKKEKPLEIGLRSLPFFYGFTIFINVFSIIHEGPHIFAELNWWMALLIALGCCLITMSVIWFVVVPLQRKTILSKLNEKSTEVNGISLTSIPANGTASDGDKKTINESLDNKENSSEKKIASENEKNTDAVKVTDGNRKYSLVPAVESTKKNDVENGMMTQSDESDENDLTNDRPEIAQLFSYLQILTACFGAFTHGGNDVSNAIGPLVAIMLIYLEGNALQEGGTPWYILLYGGIGISIGLWVWGRKVIKTMGNDLTKITPSSGFTIEVGAATTVLLATKIGLPISTTHCKVGSVVMVGRVRSKEGVDWKLFRNIAIAWILTVPITALCSAAAMALLRMAD